MMAEPLRFEEVRIRRMPGFEDQGFPLPDLSPGVNIVHGPNGSGKTTSATAMEALLWPKAASALRPSLSGRLRLGAAEWTIDLDADRAVHQRNGVAADPPLLPAFEDRDRYRLSLHELLKAEDSRFAEAIQREAAGGYDLAAARTALPPPGTGSRQFKEVRALKQALEELNSAVQSQRELHARERELSSLRAEHEEAAGAARLGEALRAALKHAAARDAEERAHEAVSTHPPEMADMRGDEHDRLLELHEELREIDLAVSRAEKRIWEADTAMLAAALPPDADAALVTGLRAEVEVLREAERELAAAERDHAAATGRSADELAGIGGAVEEDVLENLDAAGLAGLADFARRSADARARLRAVQAQAAALEPDGATDAPSAEASRLSDGARILRAWLRSADVPDASGLGGQWLSIFPGLVLLVGGLALWAVTPTALLLALAGAVVLVFAFIASRERRPRSQAVHRAEYERLDLTGPDAWEPGAVERLHDELEERRARAAAAAVRHEQRRALEPVLAEALETVAGIDEERAALAERLGVEPATDETGLVALVDRISRWQSASAEVQEAERALGSAREQVDSHRRVLAERLLPYTEEAPQRLGEIVSAVQRLEDRLRERDDALRDRKTAVDALAEHGVRRQRCADGTRAVYARAGLPDGDLEGLRRRCEAHAGYREAKRVLDEALVVAREARARVLERGGSEDLLGRSEMEIGDSILEAEAQASRMDELAKAINATETRVKDAKKLHDIEGRLAMVERLKDELREVRERETRGTIAEVLFEHVRREANEDHLPAVFSSARELFARITRGRYTLELSSDPGAAFRARDNQARRGRSLDELSSGTRVQLLLAVRVAFVESREAEARLPLILDEVLGNSDDERAEAIMDALIELAADGRQIFYLTAQRDEVQKWAVKLEARKSVPWRVIDLADVSRGARKLQINQLRVSAPAAVRSIPAPDGRSHVEYGGIIDVPRIDRVAGHAGNLHLWYLIVGTEALHAVLRAGPSTWGELEGFVRSTGDAVVKREVFARAAALARAADAWFDAVRVGAGRPLDRSALLQTDAITVTFREPADAVRERVNGDAKLLLAAIEGGELKRFRSDKLEQLREYLTGEGFIDGRAPLTPAEVRNRVAGAVVEEMGREIVSLAEIDQLIARLGAGAAD